MKPWHKNYPADAAYEIDPSQYDSLADLFQRTVNTYQDKAACVSFGAELSFNEVDKLSADFAAYLQNELSVKKGDRIALMCPNSFPFIVAMWGIIRAGAVQVNVNPLYTPRELQHQLNDAQVDTIVIFAGSTPVLAEIVENTSVKNIVVAKLDDLVNKGLPDSGIDPHLTSTLSFTEGLAKGEKLEFNAPKISLSDLLFLQYTGGTTGLSKGAMLSHGNLVANILQFHEFTKNNLVSGEEIVMTAIPMYHIFALAVNGLAFFSIGATNILITNPRDMPSFVATWAQTKPTAFTGVNTLYNGLLHTPGFDEIDFSTLKMSVGGGAPVQQAVSDKWKTVTGRRIDEGYGLSETSPILTLNFGVGDDYIPGIGVPVSSTDISLRDDNGNVVKEGESGELCAKGPQVMSGYWENSEATAGSMTDDGYFRTGDIAELDDFGFFHIVDRKKDMILVSGFNVYPNEIEAEVAKMPGILECACIGVDDESSGEAVKVFAVKTDATITAEDVTLFCRDGLAGYKVPKQVVFIDEVPKSSVGKILRRELRD
ncbi:MAG: AMP-binding protein [Gammaproteobacteria bacterium]|nr:AMP-binding protein [Gammaproteobacteria bacterium]